MLNECPCAGIRRADTSKSTIPQRQPLELTVSCSQTYAVDHLSVASSVEKTSRKVLKRSRSHDDIAVEEEHTHRKKRRLRLDLVTSRLSRPYATPATHIIGTKAWRVGAWARQRFAGGKLLRKAAILNWISMKRKRGPPCAMKMSECRTGRAASTIHLAPGPSSSIQRAIAPPATFQMPSDYDLFDYEDDVVEEDESEDNEEGDGEDSSDTESQAIHSDFGRLECSDTDPDFFDTSWSFAKIEADDPGIDPIGIDPTGMEIKLVVENEKQDEVSIAPARPDIFSSLHTKRMVVGV